MKHDPSQPLLNAKHEKFAQLVANGMNYTEAYAQAGYAPHGANASRMMSNDSILRRIEWIRREAAEALGITKLELMRFLASVVSTPASEVDENSPLAQEVTRDYIGEEKEKQITRKRIKMVGKMDAAKLLTTMLGWNAPEKVEQKVEIVITKSW